MWPIAIFFFLAFDFATLLLSHPPPLFFFLVSFGSVFQLSAQGLNRASMRFMFDGQIINNTDTPALLEMEDNDAIGL